MRYRVRMLRRAEADVRGIVSYIFQHSRDGAALWLNAYRRARKRLESFADGCAFADEGENFDIDVRQLLFKTRRGRVYRMLFTIVENEVRILRVRGSGQAPVNPEELL